MLSKRLKQLRLARGLSLDELAAKMGGIVTKQALSKYELGTAQPSPVVLNKLAAALGVKSSHFWSEPTVEVEFVAYRRRSTLPKREQEKVESLVIRTLEERLKILSLINHAEKIEIPVKQWKIKKLEDVEQAATELREKWDLGMDPISSLVSTLEARWIQVIEIDADERFDGISAIASDKKENVVAGAAVVTRRGISRDRQRFSLAHELGHIVLDLSKGVEEEKAAHRFGAALLAPAEAVRREVGSRRTLVHAEELFLLKQRYGMSIQAFVRRLLELSIINESHYKQWIMDINRLGWRKEEPGELSPEQPQWFRQQVLRLLTEKVITKEAAETVLGESVDEEVPLSLIERRAFMKLSLAERRRIMQAQAEKLLSSYEDDAERQEWQGGDIVEH
ncbi:MAG: helix-turn-helix domain-containing protein [Acidobacteria bacterium]|nr:helix-turn-helix domain-containing protein [Acidobacteriota bacterium]